MAICSKCGYEVTDGSVFCPECGTRVDAAAPTVEKAEASEAASGITAKVKKTGKGINFDFNAILANKKLCKIIGAVVGVLVLVLICSKLFGGSSPESQLKAAVKAMNRRSVSYSTIEKLSMNEYKTSVMKKNLEASIKYEIGNFDSLKEYAEDRLESEFDSLDDYYDDDWKMSLEIKKVKNFKKSDDEFEAMEDAWDSYVESLEDNADYYEDRAENADDDDYEDYYNALAKNCEKFAKKYGKYKVTAVKEVKYKITIKGSDEKENETSTAMFAKVGGKWICLRGTFY